jgi:hypothetical protein
MDVIVERIGALDVRPPDTRLVGRRVPRQRRIGRQAPLRSHAQGLQKWLRQTLTESARAAARTKDTYLTAHYA